MGKVVRLMALLASIGMLSQLFRSSHSVVAPDIMLDLGISSEGLGILTSGYFFAAAAIQIPAGILVDRFGPRRVIPVMFLAASLGVMVFSASGTLAGLLLGRVLMGIGCGAVVMAALVVGARWLPPATFSAMIGAVFGLSHVGNLLGTTPMAYASEAMGWRMAQQLLAVAAVAVAVVVVLFPSDGPRNLVENKRPRASLRADILAVREVVRHPDLPPIIFMAFFGYATLSCVLSLWGSPYLHDVHGLGAVDRGNVMLMMALALGFGNILVTPLDRVFNTRKWLVFAGVLISIAIFSTLAAYPGITVFKAGVLFAVFGFVSSYTAVIVAHGRALFPDHLIGRGLTTVNCAVLLGAAVMQAITGLIVGYFETTAGHDAAIVAYRAVFGFLAITLVLALAVYSRSRDFKPRGSARM